MRRINFVLRVEYEKSFITSGPAYISFVMLNAYEHDICPGHQNFKMPKIVMTRTPGPEVIKLFPCSTQLNTDFILLMNVKMPAIVGILTFISMLNTTSERLKARNFFICRYFNFYEQFFCAQLS